MIKDKEGHKYNEDNRFEGTCSLWREMCFQTTKELFSWDIRAACIWG